MAINTQNNKLTQQFIETESLNQSGGNAEKKIWDACKKAFKDRECLGFWRYPIFSKVGERRKEPDILVIDRHLGIIIIEVKGLVIKQIQGIQGAAWNYCNFYEESGSPYEQAENHLYALLSWFDKEASLRRKVRGRALVALPNIEAEDWYVAGFNDQPSSPPIIFGDSLKPVYFLNQLESTPPVQPGNNLDDYQWELLKSVIGGSQVMRKIPKTKTDNYLINSSRQTILNKLSYKLHLISIQQLKIGTEIPAGVQRIRGVAGSGKSVILCQKVAHMHLKHPDWDIALVFFTRSLYEQMEKSVDQWLRHFSNGEVYYDKKVRSKLKILHAWGAKNRNGFYRYICKENEIRPLTVAHTEYKNPSEGLADHCISLLKQGIPRKALFDAILIDEGQDLVVDKPSLKFEGRQPFYWLAYQSLKICDPEKPEQRRLIWAYDEAQNLDTLKIPSGKELFGDGENSLLTGNHAGNIQKSHIMKKTYRTPGVVMAAAQAIGMGILRSKGMLTGITRKDEWEDIGYRINGDFRKNNSKITLIRPNENSPNPISALWKGDCIQFKVYNSRQQELEALAENIKYNLNEEGLSPDHQILVMVLGKSYEAVKLEAHVASFLSESGIDSFVPSGTRLNQFKPKYPDNDPDAFWYRGGVTVSRVTRAKGNEADLVYIVGLDSVAHNESDPFMRNELLVAMTRTRGWLNISGIKDSHCYPFYDEVDSVIKSRCEFTFTYNKKSSAKNDVPANPQLMHKP